MRQKQKTTLRFISDIHIHAIYEPGEKQISFSSTFNTFGLYTVLGTWYKKKCSSTMLKASDVIFSPSCHIVQH